MKLKTLRDADLKNKVILYRAPYDIGVKEVEGVLELEDDLRIEATLPTLRHLLQENCKIVIVTYVKRPDGKVVEKLRTTPHARKLAELLQQPVEKADDCIGPSVLERISKMKGGDILMLENVRFHPEEMDDNDDFAKELCAGKDLVVFDGFPQAHRMHASTTGILRHLPGVAGLYLEREVTMLSKLLENPKKPFTVIIGGAKISDKVDSVNNLLNLADNLLVGGAVANIFLKAEGKEMGDSFMEDVFVDQKKRAKKDWVAYAQEIMAHALKAGKKILTPVDSVVGKDKETKIISTADGIPAGWAAFDLGPQTVQEFGEVIAESKTVFVSGPMGKFEEPRFSQGTLGILEAIEKMQGDKILAGGDTIDAVRRQGKLANYSHVSLAGGATLEFLAGKTLPALVPLMK